MTNLDYKTQARRLQSALSSNAALAQSLSLAKHSACLEAVAAVHGTRNWNTLAAAAAVPESAPVDGDAAFDLTPPPDLGPIMGGLRPGQVLFHAERERESLQFLRHDIVNAMAEGYHATVLEAGRNFHHLALAFSGTATTPAQASTDATPEAVLGLTLQTSRLARAPIAVVDFQGYRLTEAALGAPTKDAALERAWSVLLPSLSARACTGGLVVLSSLREMGRAFGEQWPLLLQYLVEARQNGAVIVCAGPADALERLRTALPPTLETKAA